MKSRSNKIMVASLATALSLLGGAAQVIGATSSGTLVTNTADISYSVNSVDLNTTSNTVGFVVDSKIALTVTENNLDYVTVQPGNNDGAALKFTITNTGNEILDIDLSTVQFADSTADPYTGTDNLTLDSTTIYPDNGSGTAPNTSSSITSIADLNYDTGSGGNDVVVWVVVDVPDAAADNAIAALHLVAEATQYGAGDTAVPGASEAPEDNNDAVVDSGEVDVVLADTQGSYTVGDNNNDAIHSDHSAVQVSAPTMDVVKGVSGNTDGYYIPGDTATYTITVTNNGSNSASSVTISDEIPSNTTYVDGSLSCTASVGSSAGTPDWSNDAGTTWGATESDSATAVQCNTGTVVSGGGTNTMTFNVTIN